MAERSDYYGVLGVPRTADAAAIKVAYRRLAFTCHPDRAGNDPAAVERFQAITKAYAVLTDPDARQRYDRGDDLTAFGASAARGVAADVFRRHIRDTLRNRHGAATGGVR